ncbi:MAG: hypothetical protein FWC51_02435 [Proteobacteria bacterium]|nr:hypothetical protein [Pseudomonadota bacterium]
MQDLLTTSGLNFNRNDLGTKIGTKTGSVYICDIRSYHSGVWLNVIPVNTFSFKDQQYTIIKQRAETYLVANELRSGDYLIYETRPFQLPKNKLFSPLSPKVKYFVIDQAQGIVNDNQFALNSKTKNNFTGPNYEKLIKNAPKLIDYQKRLYKDTFLYNFIISNPDYILETCKINESAEELPKTRDACIEFIIKNYAKTIIQ